MTSPVAQHDQTYTGRMPDPRIQRTRDHVLGVVRIMLATPSDSPLTFTSVAAEAEVSRRTLYTHWGTIDRLIADAVSVVFDTDEAAIDELPVDDRLLFFLTLTRDRMAMPLTAAAFSMLMSRSLYDEGGVIALKEIGERGRELFERHVGPITQLQYELIVGPIFHAELMSKVGMTDDQIRELAEFARPVLQGVSAH
jgi:AcrR family transcriptional regulator